MTRAQVLARSLVARGDPSLGARDSPCLFRLLAVLIMLAFLAVGLSVDVWLPGDGTDTDTRPRS